MPQPELTRRLLSGEHHVQRLTPLVGVEKTELASLSDATAECECEVEYMSDLVSAALDFADDNIRFVQNGRDAYGLTRDEIGAIHRFTLEGAACALLGLVHPFNS